MAHLTPSPHLVSKNSYVRDENAKTGSLRHAIQQRAELIAKQRTARTWKTYAVRDSDTANAGQRELRKARNTGAERRKLARGLIEKAADDLPGEEVAPDDVLKRSHALLLKAFRKSYGRDPQPGDDEFWQAYRNVVVELRAVVEAQRAGAAG